jgi:ElaA protein
MTDFSIFDAALADVSSPLLYRLLALRVDVFVVEQNCAYPELDGRDLEAGARLVWAARDDTVLGTMRILDERDGVVRIGRVATAVDAREAGVGAAMLRRAIELAEGRVVVLSAQTHLNDWYGGFGFVRDGDDFLEDGILHTPMRRGGARTF